MQSRSMQLRRPSPTVSTEFPAQNLNRISRVSRWTTPPPSSSPRGPAAGRRRGLGALDSRVPRPTSCQSALEATTTKRTQQNDGENTKYAIPGCGASSGMARLHPSTPSWGLPSQREWAKRKEVQWVITQISLTKIIKFAKGSINTFFRSAKKVGAKRSKLENLYHQLGVNHKDKIRLNWFGSMHDGGVQRYPTQEAALWRWSCCSP